MNILGFQTVLRATLQYNTALHDAGASVKDYLVPMAWGDPGLGKTDGAEAVAADLGWDLIYADLATRDPADLGGMPWVRDGQTIRCRPDWLPEQGRGILFLDELPQAGLANLNIAATLIREHRIGEHKLPAGWMVVCAGNHQHNRAGTTTLPSHLRNRLMHLEIEADANAWAKWASARGLDPMLIAFNLARANDFHHKFSSTENAYPTPRSWAASDHVFRLALPDDLKRECADGIVGAAASADFAGFRAIANQMIGIDAILADPDRAPLPDDLADRRNTKLPSGAIMDRAMMNYAVMGMLSYHARPQTFAAIIRYLDRLPEQEFAVACVRDATARDPDLEQTSAYQRWAAAHGSLLSGR
jgi:hypothetical protein